MIHKPASVHDRIALAEEVRIADLEHVIGSCRDEFLELAGSRILITGGAGFLGYYLVQAPLHWNRSCSVEQRIQVTVHDNFVRGLPGWLERLGDGDGALRVVRHDTRDPLPVDVADMDWVFHAAGIASPMVYRQHPIATMDANIVGLRNLLDHSIERARTGRPLRNMVFFSSSEIYGDPDPDRIPTPEDYRGYVSCTGPRSCYDESKRYGETLCVAFVREHGVPVSMVRPFNNYGPGLRLTDGRVIPDFARDILAGRDIVLRSDGTATRTFCYVADAVSGYYKALVRGQPGEPYNIGVDEPEVTVRELAERMQRISAELLAYSGAAHFEASDDEEYLVDNPARRCPDMTKSRSELGYTPSIGLDEGLRRSLLWYAGDPSSTE
jgi:nucleoside-diphosphate-sugar epimerase